MEWNGEIVRTWLASRIAAARTDQVAAQRGGRDREDDCAKAAAEEMVCTILNKPGTVATQQALAEALRALLDRDEYIWSGVYNDTRFDRHVRTYARKLARMTKANQGFENTLHYQ